MSHEKKGMKKKGLRQNEKNENEKKKRFCPPGGLWGPKITIEKQRKITPKYILKSIFRGPSGPFFHFSGPSGPIFTFSGPAGHIFHFPGPAGLSPLFSGPCGAFLPIFRALRGLYPRLEPIRISKAWAPDPEKKRIPMKKKKRFRPGRNQKKKALVKTFFSQPCRIVGAAGAGMCRRHSLSAPQAPIML